MLAHASYMYVTALRHVQGFIVYATELSLARVDVYVRVAVY